MQYRRDYTDGGTYFFTVVTHRRRPWLGSPKDLALLRECFREERTRRPFVIDAIVILPDHLHTIWTLSVSDCDYSIRWRNIKRAFTLGLDPSRLPDASASRRHKREQAVWQRRFWEHRIRDDADFARHVDYIHYNPVKHGYVGCPADWPSSSLHWYIRRGVLPADWGTGAVTGLPDVPE